MKIIARVVLSLAAMAIAVAVQAGPLQVGAARVDITALAYPDGKVPATQYDHEHIYMRAILLDNGETRAAFIGADLSGLKGVWEIAAPQIADEFDIPLAQILMSASHTHGAQGRNPEGYSAAIMRTLRIAESQLRPARMAYGEGSAYLSVNRNVIDAKTRLWTQDSNLDAPSDKTLAVMAFYDPDGAPIAAYVNYAMHPVTSYLVGFLTADFPGAASRHVEQAFGDEMVMVFSKGFEGDQNPLHLRTGTNVMAALAGVETTGYELDREPVEAQLREHRVEPRGRNPAADRELKDWLQAQGMVLGEEAIRVMSHMDRFQDQVRIGGGQQVLSCPGREVISTGPAREGYPGTYSDGADAQIQMTLIGINDVAIGAITSDAFTMIGQKIKNASPLQHTMLVSHANLDTDVGYIYADADSGQMTFQVLQSRLKPGCAEPGLVRNFTDMIYAYMD